MQKQKIGYTGPFSNIGTHTKAKERIGKALFLTEAILCVVAVLAIFIFLIVKSLPAFNKLGVFDFIFGDTWSPDRLDRYDDATLSGTYGIFTMIVGTLAATVGALLVGGVLGYFVAVFLAFYCPKRLKRVLASFVSLLAGIPSVVYGFFGIAFLLPLLSNIAPNNGSGLLATSLILGIMILPTVVSLSRTALEAVPRAYYEGSVALGANHSETVFRIMAPAARSGITASLILGVGRALGETMAVVMVAGNAPTYPDGLFNSFRVMTANIVMEMGYAGEVQEGALVATGVVLLVFVLLVNAIFSAVSQRAVKKTVKLHTEKRTSTHHDSVVPPVIPEKEKEHPLAGKIRAMREGIGSLSYRLKLPVWGKVASLVSGVIVSLTLVLIVGFIFAKGLPHLIQNPHLLVGQYEFGSENITILPSLVATLMAAFLSLIIAVPIGVMTAVYLNEYAKRGSRIVRLIRGAIDILSGVPSIVYGLFGMITFVKIFGGTSSILSGSLTVSIMLLPTIVRSTEESLKAVSDSLREASFGLGAGKLRTVMKVVLPSALPGILSAVILSIGRVISESAPFLYTMGSVITAMPTSYSDSGATLAVALYQLSGEGWYMDEAYATAVVLIVLVLGLNLLAEAVASRLNKKLQGEGNA